VYVDALELEQWVRESLGRIRDLLDNELDDEG
jgi:hypothetical protein